MSVYLVTWDLNKEKPNYSQARSAFVSQLQTYEYTKDSGLDSVWFISTSSTADQIDTFLRKKLDTDDRIIVTKLEKGNHQGWLNKGTWEWIDARI